MGGDDCGSKVMSATYLSGTAGALFGCVQAAWEDKPMVKDQTVPMLKFAYRRIAGATVFFALAGGVFAAAACAAEGYRHKKDAWNTAIGGAAAGALVGVRSGNLGTGLLAASTFALVCGVVDWRSASFDPSKSRAAEILQTWKKEQQESK
eukprot:comp19560_c0_seq1/m.22953 comp19560_c0_seq1/g.22953  ORF comp19560_c0_seq1/g.22953 comp19560_c0_seq1/m.22953 type:complete len:150 (-) comp19560_c0_seq1:187-636(-)